MRYSALPNQPVGGRLPSMIEVGPPDLRYSSSTSPLMQPMIDRRYGRHLAGTDTEVSDEHTDQGMAKNELDYYAAMDDVQGNGVFDPPGTHGNIHPDAGIFTARFDIPGYLARERMYTESEVREASTGRPVIYVNGGAVAMDDAARVAFIENSQYAQPKPMLDYYGEGSMQSQSIVNPRVHRAMIPRDSAQTAPVSASRPAVAGFGATEPMSGAKLFVITAALGLAAGAAYAVFRPKKK